MPYIPGMGERFARQNARLRTRGGTLMVTIGGAQYPAVVSAIEGRERDMLAEGLGDNAGNPDLRNVYIPMSAISAIPLPREGDIIQIADDGVNAVSYTILRRPISGVAGTPIDLSLTVYRTPSAPAQTDAATGESDAGHRKTYWPQPAAS